jgi:hypothetical protein
MTTLNTRRNEAHRAVAGGWCQAASMAQYVIVCVEFERGEEASPERILGDRF